MGLPESEFTALAARFAANRGWAVQPIERMELTKPLRKHKYGVAPKEQRIVDGILFASKAEATAYQELLAYRRMGMVSKIELQPAYKFPPGFSYVADFRITWADGHVEVIDVKGVETAVFKLKHKCMKFYYPEVDLTLWKKGSR